MPCEYLVDKSPKAILMPFLSSDQRYYSAEPPAESMSCTGSHRYLSFHLLYLGSPLNWLMSTSHGL